MSENGEENGLGEDIEVAEALEGDDIEVEGELAGEEAAEIGEGIEGGEEFEVADVGVEAEEEKEEPEAGIYITVMLAASAVMFLGGVVFTFLELMGYRGE